MSINSFHSFVVGANSPVGNALVKRLAEQGYVYKSLTFDSQEQLTQLAASRPFLLLLPSVFNPTDLTADLSHWLKQAELLDAKVVLLSSLAVFPKGEPLWREEQLSVSNSSLARQLLLIEEKVKEFPRHLILRVGQVFSLQEQDFAWQILQNLRQNQALTLDNSEVFSPTPAIDVADVLLAMLKQANCNERLWGCYHFSGVEPVTAFKFAEALLAELKQRESLQTNQLAEQAGGMMPSIEVASADNTKLFYSFGIKSKAWRKQVAKVVQDYYAQA